MRRSVLFLLAVWAVSDCAALSHLAFEMAAFNRACPTGAVRTVAFSPLAFELDAVAFAEAGDTLTRAHTSETIGVLSGFEAVYAPILANLDCRTNGLSLVTARGFCVPEIRKAHPSLVQLLQMTYRTEVCRMFPIEGTAAWFRSAMDGEMETFTPVIDRSSDSRYAFYDLVSARWAWADPFPTNNTRSLTFRRADGTRVKRNFLTDLRPVDAWSGETYEILRLPLRGDRDFLAFLPKPGFGLDDIKRELQSVEDFSLLFARPRRAEGKRVSHASALVVLPKLDLIVSNDLLPLMDHFRFPYKGLSRLVGDHSPRCLRQDVRFRFDSQGPDETPIGEKPAERQTRATADTRKFVFNRPFLFVLYDEAAGTVPLAGQILGETD